MRYKQILLFFCIALPVSLAMRLIQLFHIVDSGTGFYSQGFEGWGNAITVIIIAVAAAIAIFAFFSHHSPENPPKVNLGLGLFSGLLAFTTAVELFFGGDTFGAVIWQKGILYALGILFVIWLVLFAIKDFINIKLPKVTYIIPCLYFTMKIICNFAGIASLALISDNILLIAAYCTTLLFMLNFAKLYNNLDTERGFRKLLAWGLSSVLLCFTQSVPNVVFHVATNGGYSHVSMVTNFSMFCTGLFVAMFIFTHFSYKNACK